MGDAVTIEKSLRIFYTGDTKGLEAAQKRISTGTDTFSKKLTTLGKSLSATGASMTKKLTAPIVAGFGVAIHLASEQDAAVRLLGRSFDTAGIKGSKALQEMIKFNEDLAGKIGVSETVLAQLEGRVTSMGGAFLKSLGPAGAERDIQHLTVGMENLAAASGKSINMLMRSLGPAILNQPDKAASSLQKYGILTAGQVAQTKKLVAAGKANVATQLEINAIYGKNAGAAAKAMTPAQHFEETLHHLGIVIGQILMPIFTKVSDWLSKAVGMFSKLSPSMQHIVVIVLAIVAAIGPLLVIVGKLFSLIGMFGEGGALASLLSPWTLVVAAVVVAVILIIKHWQGVKRVLVDIWHGLVAVWHAVWDKIGSTVRLVGNIIKGYVKIWIGAVKIAFKILLTAWRIIWAAIKDEVRIAIGIFKIEFAIISAVWRTVWGAVKAIASPIFAFLKQAAHDIGSAFTKAWGGIKSVGVAIWGSIKTAAVDVFNGIATIWDDTVGRLSFKVPSWVPFLGGHGFSMPQIPHFATGGLSMGGMALVGERGPEIVSLPAGSYVHPNGRAPGGMTIVVNVAGHVLEGKELAMLIQREFVLLKRRNGGNLGF